MNQKFVYVDDFLPKTPAERLASFYERLEHFNKMSEDLHKRRDRLYTEYGAFVVNLKSDPKLKDILDRKMEDIQEVERDIREMREKFDTQKTELEQLVVEVQFREWDLF